MKCRRCDHEDGTRFDLCEQCWSAVDSLMRVRADDWSQAYRVIKRHDAPGFWAFNRLAVWCRQFERRLAA